MTINDHPSQTPARAARQGLPVYVMVLGTVLYGTLVTVAVMRGWPHYEWLAIFLQAAVLLPALTYGLRGSGSASRWTPAPAGVAAGTALLIAVLLIGSAALSEKNVQGVSIPDESAYRFQARILATGHLMAAAPPGAPAEPADAPVPLRFNHIIVWRNGWFGKYPLGWPLVVALAQKLGCEWLANPLLAAGILICTAGIARAIGGPVAALLAVALLVFSPGFLAQCVVLMSHPLAGLLVAAACWAWQKGTRKRELRHFALMYLVLGLNFHVRPFTALLTALTLTGGAVWMLRRERALLVRVVAIAAGVGVLALGSVLLYNRAFTGDPWLSPYAFIKGVNVPIEISASPVQALRNIIAFWRFSAQSTVLFLFPLILVLAGIGFWKNRRTPMVGLLLALVVVIVAGHLVQTEPSASVLAERYWFEAFFALAILGALGIIEVARALQSPRGSLIVAAAALLAVQTFVTLAAVKIILQRSAPSAAVAHLADQYRDCRCVVFVESSLPAFAGQHMNLNGPNWAQANVFYAVDPGPGQRVLWTRTLGRDRFIVVTYDPVQAVAQQVAAEQTP